MANQFTIPELLSINSLRHSHRLAQAIQTMAAPGNEAQYHEALRAATEEITGLSTEQPATNTGLSFQNVSRSPQLQQAPKPQKTAGGLLNRFGLPVFQPVIIRGVRGVFDDLLLESAIVGCNRPKEIVVTKVRGRNNTVKEFISNGDWVVNVSGIIANTDNTFPLEQLKQLNKVFSYQGSLRVVNEKLNALGIHEIVITYPDLPYSPYVNLQTYSFEALEEEPARLRI